MIVKARKTVQILTLALLVLVPVLNKKGITFLSGSLYSFAVGPVWITDPLIGMQTLLTAMTVDAALLLSMTDPGYSRLGLRPGLLRLGLSPEYPFGDRRCLARNEVRDQEALRGADRPPCRAMPSSPSSSCSRRSSGFPWQACCRRRGSFPFKPPSSCIEGMVGLELGADRCDHRLVELVPGPQGLVQLCLPRREAFSASSGSKKTLKVVFAEDAEHVCGNCLACADACGLGLDPMKAGIYPQCHNCGECIAACEDYESKEKTTSLQILIGNMG